MDDSSPPQPEREKYRDRGNWAEGISTLKVTDVPEGAVNLNVEGRRPVGPLQGFGPLWQKTYRVRLEGCKVTPAEVVSMWKANFQKFQPRQNRFYPTRAGFNPGEVVLINATMTGVPVDAGVMVLYADDESFTVMTPEGFPESGFNSFSAYTDGNCTVVQIQSIARANDPIYELGFRMIGSRQQERIWKHVLTGIAAHYGVKGEVEMLKVCLDPKVQWSEARNVWKNASVRSIIYVMATPVRRIRQMRRRRTPSHMRPTTRRPQR